MAFVTLDTNGLLQDEPLTSQEVLALYENVFAARNGDFGAPVESTSWHPHNATTAGASSGLIWSHAVSGDTGTIETPVFAAGYDYRLGIIDLGGGDIQINLRRQTTGAYATAAVLFAGTASLRQNGYVEIEFPFIARAFQKISGGDAPLNFNLGVDSAVDRARLTTTSTNFTRGAVYLFRRRVEGF
jgi:hypothetical protein